MEALGGWSGIASLFPLWVSSGRGDGDGRASGTGTAGGTSSVAGGCRSGGCSSLGFLRALELDVATVDLSRGRRLLGLDSFPGSAFLSSSSFFLRVRRADAGVVAEARRARVSLPSDTGADVLALGASSSASREESADARDVSSSSFVAKAGSGGSVDMMQETVSHID